MIGYFLATSMLYRGIGVLCGAPVFIRYFKLSDYTMAIISLSGTILMYIVLAFSTDAWMLFVGMYIQLVSMCE